MRINYGQKLGLVLSSVAIAALAFAGVAGAQDISEPMEFIGVVDAMSDSSLTINGQTITLDGATLLGGDFQTGDSVLVEADMNVNGSLVAGDVLGADASLLGDGEMLITGRVNNAAAGMVQIGNHLIDTANADVNGALEQDSVVAIVADSYANGVFAATDIFVAGSDANANADLSAAFDLNGDNTADLDHFTADEFSLIGTLDSVDEADNSLVISGRTIEMTDAAVANDLVIGSLVQAQVSDTGNNLFADLVRYADVHTDGTTDTDMSSRSTGDANSAADTSVNGSLTTGAGVAADPADFNPNAEVQTGLQSGLGTSAGQNAGDTSVDTGATTNSATGAGVPADPADFNPNAELQTGLQSGLGASAGRGANG